MIKKLLFVIAFLGNGFAFSQNQKLKDEQINECSGLVVSSLSDHLMWVHNDSGDKSRIYLINDKGNTIATYNFGKEVRDCEDIALAYHKNEASDIFIGDIGDNKAERPYIRVFKFKEPDVKITSGKELKIAKVEELKFKYPNGARDAECLMVDTRDQKIYIISKREDSVGVYSAPLNSKAGSIITLKKEADLFFDAPKVSKWVTGGDISRNGKVVVVKTYINIYYWDRGENETIPECLKRAYIGLPYKPEGQGEAVGLTRSGRYYYSIPEGKFAEITFKAI